MLATCMCLLVNRDIGYYILGARTIVLVFSVRPCMRSSLSSIHPRGPTRTIYIYSGPEKMSIAYPASIAYHFSIWEGEAVYVSLQGELRTSTSPGGSMNPLERYTLSQRDLLENALS